MLDLSNFPEQFPDPNKDEVLRIIEKIKLALIEHFSLAHEPNTSHLTPVTSTSDFEALRAYMLAYEFIHEQGIATTKMLMPAIFADLVQSELTNWIPSPKISKSP